MNAVETVFTVLGFLAIAGCTGSATFLLFLVGRDRPPHAWIGLLLAGANVLAALLIGLFVVGHP